MFEYTIERNDKQRRLVLNGDLTASALPKLQAALKAELAHDANEVIFDLRKTLMLDSSGIGLLIATHNSLTRKQGTLRVVQVSDDILQMLQSMRLVSRLNVTGKETGDDLNG